MFQWWWHDDIANAHVYEMTCNLVEAKHRGCYNSGERSPQRGRRRAGQRHGLAGQSSSSFPLSLSPAVAAHGARARCRWVSAMPRLAQSSLRCSRFLLFWDFAFASLIRPFDDFDSCSRVWPRMPVVPMFVFSVFICERMAPIGNDTANSCSKDCACDFIFVVFFLSFSLLRSCFDSSFWDRFSLFFFAQIRAMTWVDATP